MRRTRRQDAVQVAGQGQQAAGQLGVCGRQASLRPAAAQYRVHHWDYRANPDILPQMDEGRRNAGT
jgi:hypothetical protein